MADGCLIENREVAVGVQVFHMRRRWGRAAVWRAQTQVLLGGLSYALPGWEEAESRCAAGPAAEASWRPHAASGAVGWQLAAVGGSTAVDGVLGTAATWVASAGNGVAVREARAPRLVGACGRQVRAWGGGAALLGL